MSSTMTYKGQTARIEFDARDDILVGRLVGITDVVSFHADNVADLRVAFEEAVDDYLDTCAQLDRPPQKTYSGKLSLRLGPELHATVAVKAELQHKSINQWVADVLSREAHA